ncbi:MAG: AAA family ATPase [Pseudobutyrivibrio sp.]|nr:AAA family ATPase [Pseudobutyrivibrio sp.]
MPVFDFSKMPQKGVDPVMTYTTFASNEAYATVDCPILIIEDSEGKWCHHADGMFTNPVKRTSFEFETSDGVESADILSVDSRFTSLLTWLGENHIKVRLSGAHTDAGYNVYKIKEVASGKGSKLSAEDGFLQYMIDRLFMSNAVSDAAVDEDDEELEGDDMKLTSIQSITDFLTCAGRTLPDNIRLWARRNLSVAKSNEVTPEERRHAQRALSMMMNIQWKNDYFESIDPVEARRILDEELYGLERVKQRIMETVIQINRTHTLPAYGLLLCGPAGVGKSQIAYAVARILKLPWTTLDMSSINDPEQLTGSSRIYSNAKSGIIMDAFSQAGTSNLVFIINELDKANSGKGNGNPADVLLTLLDNLGFTDNYMECMIPTTGVYPIATANDKSMISAPLMSRFAVIDIPDYSDEEKKIIFERFAMPKVLKRMGMRKEECVVTPDGLDAVIAIYGQGSGIRNIEQAAEHLAANALYRIEVDKVDSVIYDRKAVEGLEV